MAQTDADRVHYMFAKCARDVTPRGARNAATVLFAPYSRDDETTSRYAAILTEFELGRAARILRQDARANFIQRRAFRRYCAAAALKSPRPMSNIAFSETDKGRPHLSDLPNMSLSFSSCRFGFVGAWSSTHEIGVDIEDTTKDIEAAELADRFFSNTEARAIRGAEGRTRLRMFYRLWNLKEASLKSIGEGLPFGLDAFEFELASSPQVVHAPSQHGGATRFQAYEIDLANCCGALVIRSGRLSSRPVPL